MISIKTAAALLFIILNMQLEVFASKRTKRPGSSGKAVLNKKRKHASRRKSTVPKLMDSTTTVKVVDTIVKSTETMSISQEQPVSQVNEFEELIKQKNFKKIFELGERMDPDEFMKQLSPAVKTLEQYNGILSGLKDRSMGSRFYLYGDVGVIKAALVESRVYEDRIYVNDGDLETALILAFKEDHHDRVVQLLNVRQEISVEEDEKDKQNGYGTSFESFVGMFLFHLAPQKDDMPLRRFLAFRGKEFREKHPDILDTLCKSLVDHLGGWANEPKTKKLITDLIGQSYLLTPTTFTKGFLYEVVNGENCSNFMNYAWDEPVRVGLTSGPMWNCEHLWRMMTMVRPKDFIGDYPSTPDALATVLKQFPTKQKLEEDWHKKTVMLLYNKLSSFELITSFPTVLLFIISEYAVSLTVTEDSTTTTK